MSSTELKFDAATPKTLTQRKHMGKLGKILLKIKLQEIDHLSLHWKAT